MTVTRVLSPTDLSEASAHAAEWAIAVAGCYKAAITPLMWPHNSADSPLTKDPSTSSSTWASPSRILEGAASLPADQQRDSGHDHAAGAVAALHGVFIHEGALHAVQSPVRAPQS